MKGARRSGDGQSWAARAGAGRKAVGRRRRTRDGQEGRREGYIRRKEKGGDEKKGNRKKKKKIEKRGIIMDI